MSSSCRCKTKDIDSAVVAAIRDRRRRENPYSIVVAEVCWRGDIALKSWFLPENTAAVIWSVRCFTFAALLSPPFAFLILHFLRRALTSSHQQRPCLVVSSNLGFFGGVAGQKKCLLLTDTKKLTRNDLTWVVT